MIMNSECEKLHRIIKKGKRFNFKSNFFIANNNFPENGIYLMVEKGEKGHGGLRVVRVGINKSGNRTLAKRLSNHINGNTGNSIFRKHLGRIIQKNELAITRYIRENISFYIINDLENKRELLEKKIIGTISNCRQCKPLEDWKGLKSESHKIRKSGLYNIHYVFSDNRLDDDDLNWIKENLI